LLLKQQKQREDGKMSPENNPAGLEDFVEKSVKSPSDGSHMLVFDKLSIADRKSVGAESSIILPKKKIKTIKSPNKVKK
jgi:hypothetical protein